MAAADVSGNNSLPKQSEFGGLDVCVSEEALISCNYFISI